MTSPTARVSEPVIDTPVWTRDGEQFGYVREIHGGYFKIDVPMAKDYWLSNSYIESSTLDKVTLNLNKDEIDEHRLSAPGVEDQNTDHIIPDAEALAQREKMERELEEQNAKLRAERN